MSERKPVLPWLGAALDEIEATTPATTRLWGTERRAELRAAEAAIRAMRRMHPRVVGCGNWACPECKALDRFDKLTRPTQRKP